MKLLIVTPVESSTEKVATSETLLGVVGGPKDPKLITSKLAKYQLTLIISSQSVQNFLRYSVLYINRQKRQINRRRNTHIYSYNHIPSKR